MNVKYINPLLHSTVNVLSTMAFIEATPGRPEIKSTLQTLGDITGFIDLNGAHIDGWLAISFSQSTILKITHNMLGEESASIDETIVDAVGEITNMISGGAKRIYAERGLDIDMARPSVLVGKGQTITERQLGHIVKLPFTTPAGDMHVEFCFR